MSAVCDIEDAPEGYLAKLTEAVKTGKECVIQSTLVIEVLFSFGQSYFITVHFSYPI